MPRYDWGSTQSITGGGGYTVPNGGYVLKIVSVEFGRSRAGNDQLKLVWDIAEGEHADIAAANGWYDSKHTDYISLAPKALGFAKAKLEAIARSNPNFDPFAAVGNDQWGAFSGRIFGATLKLEYGEWQGKQTKKMVIDKYLSADDIRAGRFVVPVTEEPEEPQPVAVPPTFGQTVGFQPQPQASSFDTSNIPF